MWLLIILLVAGLMYYQIHKFNQSTYKKITNNNPIEVYFNKGKVGEYLIYDKLKSYETVY